MPKSRIPIGSVLALAAVASLACSDAPSAAQQAPPVTPPSDQQVVAEVGGRKITLKELDAKWEEFDAAERNRVTQLLYQNRRNMLDQLLGDVVIEQAAKAAGIAVDVYTQQESAKLIQPVTEADIVAFYNQNKDRANGRTLEQLRGPVKDFLDGQRRLQAKAQLVENLRNKDASIKVMLEPPRYTVQVASHNPVRGDVAAPISIIEFSDYQCPFCQRVTPTLQQVRDTYGAKVKIIFKDFPLPNHAQAFKASEAAHCAGEQGKYWEMHDKMFANQGALEVPALKASAAALGLSAAEFDQCLDSGKFANVIREDMAQGEKLGVNSTPTLYINGRPLIGAQPFEAFKQAIDEELAKNKK
jgi:protein-disulfide isomerase